MSADLFPNTTTLSSESPHNRGHISSDVRQKGIWTRLIFQLRDEPGPSDVVPPTNQAANPVPLQATLSAPAASARISELSRDSQSSRAWLNLFEPPDPLEDQGVAQRENVARLHRPEGATLSGSVPPTSGQRRSPVSPGRILSPITVAQWTGQSPIQTHNPAYAQIINPGSILVDSPIAITPGVESRGPSSPDGVREPACIHNILHELASLDFLVTHFRTPTRQATESSVGSWTTARQYERRLLIIGSSYNDSNWRMSTHFSVASAAEEPLSALQNDVEDLESCFRRRGYSVETMTGEDFSREDVLTRVAGFLRTASLGDVRAIVFTGHARRSGTALPVMVPPISPRNPISANDWNQNIRGHASPGVVVLSILSTCFSGGFADQGVRISDFSNVREMEDVESQNTPIFVTFSSSGLEEKSYESPVGTDEPRCRDHFLWALAGTARDPQVRTWHQFITILRERFAYARVKGAEGVREGSLPWLCENPQNPTFTTSVPDELPPWDTIFPANSEGDSGTWDTYS